ncbi:MAG: GNAT family N-acetyltransferase [Oscillospiraceae bacterium]|nr:GNAT family N-acetyltransferase [Oscillospiraceae bacterium]
MKITVKNATPVLNTTRLLLRPVKYEDIYPVHDLWMRDEEVSRYMFWKASSDINKTKEFIEYELENTENDKWNRWFIELTETGELIGTCLIFYNNEENNWDISYNLARKYQGHGYITEAMTCVLKYAHESLKIKECIAIHAVENPASGKVIERLGFTYEKDVPYECSGGEIKTTGRYYRLVF